MAALVVAAPLGVAAALIGVNAFVRIPRRALDTIAIGTAAGVTVTCLVLVHRAAADPVVSWFGDWKPQRGVVVGIPFYADPFAAAGAAIAGLLVTASLVFSWRYFAATGPLFHTLMLIFLAGMVGFSFAADFFNLFVFFEVMSIAGYALTGVHVEETSPLQGALNFAITNSIGAMMILLGIALVYGRTGTLNLAAAGQRLAREPVDGLVIIAFALLAIGLFVKAAVVPFHFWLPDAHTVAPTPVCALFSAIMIELAVYVFARIYWVVFSGAFDAHEQLRVVLAVAGALTAVIGAVMCFLQFHLKRLLAFSAVAHSGVMVGGIAVLGPVALAGAAVYILGHACVKAALFLGAGVVRHRCRTLNEAELHGQGRRLGTASAVFLLGALGLAGVPPFGTFAGKSLIEDGALHRGLAWLVPVILVASLLTGAAVLRAWARVFRGWGNPAPTRTTGAFDIGYRGDEPEEEPEIKGAGRRVPPTMWVPMVALLAVGLTVGTAPGLPDRAESAARSFTDRAGYERAVLNGRSAEGPAITAASYPTASAFVTSLATLAGAVSVASAALAARRWSRRAPRAARIIGASLTRLRRLHSGHPGDYVAFAIAGAAAFGSVFALTLR